MLLKLLQNYILPYEALKVDIVMYSLLTKLLNVCNMQVLSHKILMIFIIFHWKLIHLIHCLLFQFIWNNSACCRWNCCLALDRFQSFFV